MNVKICGITSPADARMALEEGADAIGVIVDVPAKTPRKVSLERASLIRKSVSDISHAFVAVMMPASVDGAMRICEELEPDGIQLHNDQSPGFMRELRRRSGCSLIKTVHVGISMDLDYVVAAGREADMLLLDTPGGGTGRTHDHELDLRIKEATGKRIMLAGGLNADNVAAAVARVRPYAVDASSGLESSPGFKDREKVRRFIEVSSCL